MKIHYLQHVPFEDLANIESWACINQAFIKGNAIVLQFHLEYSPDSINHLLFLIGCMIKPELQNGKVLSIPGEILLP